MNMERDKLSGAIVNTDKQALNKYKLERQYQRKVDKLELEITEMQALIKELFWRVETLEEE